MRVNNWQSHPYNKINQYIFSDIGNVPHFKLDKVKSTAVNENHSRGDFLAGVMLYIMLYDI